MTQEPIIEDVLDGDDQEIEAIRVILAALRNLQSGAQVRALNYVIGRLLPNYYGLGERGRGT